jgi:hypothetical protein
VDSNASTRPAAHFENPVNREWPARSVRDAHQLWSPVLAPLGRETTIQSVGLVSEQPISIGKSPYDKETVPVIYHLSGIYR